MFSKEITYSQFYCKLKALIPLNAIDMTKILSFRYVLLLFFAVIAHFVSAQSAEPYKSNYEHFFSFPSPQQTVVDSLVMWQENVVLQLGNIQADNNQILFKGYVLTGPNKSRFSLSKVLHVELVNQEGKVLKKQFHEITQGAASGVMNLPKKIEEGTYYLRAYTQWMQNYGQTFYTEKVVHLGNPVDKKGENREDLDVRFFPEGGVFLSGFENRMVIQIPNIENDHSDYVGSILDSKDNMVAQVSKVGPALGNVLFTPVKNQSYQLKLNNGEVYSLPSSENQGLLLHANNLDADTVKIRAIATGRGIEKAVKLIGEIEGVNYFERDVRFNNSDLLDVKISKKDFPRGVLTLKLTTGSGEELAVRPIWIDGKRLTIEVTSLNEKRTGGEQALKVKVTDGDNKPVKTGIALSFLKASSDPNLESEAFQIINEDNPTIFSDDIALDRKQRFLKDIAVLAAGNEGILAKINEEADLTQIKYPFQQGLELVGYVYDLENNLLKNTNIQVLGYSDEDILANDVKTNANGILRLEDLQVQGMVRFVLRTQGEDSKERLVKLFPLDVRKKDAIAEGEVEKPTSTFKKVERKSVYQPSIWQALDTTGLIQLDEAEIRQNKINKTGASKIRNSAFGRTVIVQDRNHPKSIPELFLNVPGVVVTGLGSLNPRISMPRRASSGPILWVIDGFPLAQSDAGSRSFVSSNSNPLVEVMNIISPLDIDKIELLIGPETAIYGSRGAGGVILITRRDGSEFAPSKRKEGQLMFQGFEPDFDFEAYKKTLSNKEQENSSILYWNPNVETNEDGEAIINFTAPKSQTKTKIEAMAISEEGAMGILRTEF